MLFRILLLMAILSAIGSFWRYRKFIRDPFGIIGIYLAITLVSECIAFYLAVIFNNNLPVFHIFSPVLFVLLAWYMDRVSPTIQKYRVAWMIGSAAVIISLLNTCLFQPLYSFNSNYLLLEGLFVCILGFIALYDYESDEQHLHLHRNPHFWTIVLFVFKQVIVFFLYIIIYWLDRQQAETTNRVMFVYRMLWGVNVLGYLVIGMIFSLFSKKFIND